ncbi:AraC family transcriptional regulator [Amycolatopsis antarctica]|uniref:AraC family transcriptional regulator n=1 Tax=Amycolatopsis antarctica TaxID=1854586 RepID=A0A263D0C8_9PSEU|nr:helix-turn-helix transcriptional regulator [Amycolatopsis antarctica]OZM71883.1 AraC family transcriptional regulator [Amycolatopsis antarctica]
MDTMLVRAVERSIGTMRLSLADKITMDDLAQSAMFSKFHFSRVFRQVTGISPGRYLSAMRIEEAKRLLTSTSLSIVDISHQVGYNSVGTFSSRFHNGVGVSPSTYRRREGAAPDEHGGTEPRRAATVVRGQVVVPSGESVERIFVGLFGTPMLHGSPVRRTVLERPGQYSLQDVPPGTWYVAACSGPPRPADADAPARHIGLHGPVGIQDGLAARIADVRLRPMRTVDPPVLTALPSFRPVADAPARRAG